jgi:hypothetical protein
VKIEYVKQESRTSENQEKEMGQLNIEGALKSWNENQDDKEVEKVTPTGSTNITDALNLSNIGKVQELKLEEEDKMQTSTTSIGTNGSDNSAKFMRNI